MRLAFIERQWNHNQIVGLAVGSWGNPVAIIRNQSLKIREWSCCLVKLKSVNMTSLMIELHLEMQKADPSGPAFQKLSR
jgi:hypothetical protein